jgi:hypothetical protein
MFLDHTQRRSTVGRTPLDELSAHRRDLYLTTQDTHNRKIFMPPEESYQLWCVVVCDLETSRIGAPCIYDISSIRVNDLTLILLTWRKWWTPNNASKWQMGFNSVFKGLKGDFGFRNGSKKYQTVPWIKLRNRNLYWIDWWNVSVTTDTSSTEQTFILTTQQCLIQYQIMSQGQ